MRSHCVQRRERKPAASTSAIASELAAARARPAATRRALLGGVWLGALAMLAPDAAHAVDGTWQGPGNQWTTGTNWSSSPDVPDGTATFTNNAAPTSVTISSTTSIGTIQFTAAAPAYSFAVNLALFEINGSGIVNNSAFTPSFTNNGAMTFVNASSAGNSVILNNTGGFTLSFTDSATAANATITTNPFSLTQFSSNATGGNARLIANSLGVVDFSGTSGPAGNNQVTAGSIEGAGSYRLGGNQITVGSNNLSTAVSGTIEDGGTFGGSGASLVKIGNGTLTLTGNNTYSGGTAINGGTLAVSADNNLGAAAGGLAFDGGTLQFNAGFTTNRTITLNAGGGTVDTSAATSSALGGTISGTGGLTKTGAGALTLLGTNNYTGGTTVNAGILFLGDATHMASIVGSITNNVTNAVGLQILNADMSGVTTITNNGFAAFFNATTAGTAIITNAGTLSFANSSSADHATITNDGSLQFFNASTSGAANITNNFFLAFANSSTAENAVIINNRGLSFQATSTAGNATIVTNSAGTTAFRANSTGGLARLVTNAGGIVDISGLTSTGMTAGSIEGAGNYQLGSKSLTVGGNNLATDVSGVIQDGGTFGGTGASLVKVGTGTLTLSGINTYTGATTVNAGTLIVNGSIASSPVTVNAGATLAGVGTVGATTINNGGTFAPGNSPGTMTVQGNLAFQSGAIYLVQVTPSLASSANVIAGGSAALAGTVNAAFAPGSYVTRNYAILSAAGGLNGTFNALTTTNLPAGFTANLGYSATDVTLNLTANLGGTGALGTSGLSINQKNVANSLNNFFNSGGALPPNFVTIFGLTGGALGNALSSLSGEAATGGQQAAFQIGNQFLGLRLDPFVDGRSGVGGAGGPALGFAPEQAALPDDVALAYSSVLKAPQAAAAPAFEQRWAAWGAAYGGGNKTSGDPAVLGSHDLSASVAGFAGGLDYRLTPNSVVGVALAGGGTSWNLVQGLGGGKSDAFQAGVYGATRWGAAYLAGAFAYTNHWMSTDRFAFASDHLTASFNAQSLGGRVEGGYRVATVYGGVTPYAAIQAQSFRTPSYSETDGSGAGFALAYNARTGTDTRSELGARFDRLIALNPSAALALRGRLAWAHDWVSDPSLAAVFQTLPGASFIVNGATPVKDSALVSAGTELRLANGVTLLGKFDGEFASRSTTYAGTGTVRYAW
jgi:autotransporter-associated beta strand protein